MKTALRGLIVLVVMTLIFHNAEKSFDFKWCSKYNFEYVRWLCQESPDIQPCLLCYLTTESTRLYLKYDERHFSWAPYVLVNNSWRVLNRHQWKVCDVISDNLSTESELVRALELQHVRQWRDSITGYYSEFPDRRYILSALGESPHLETLEYLKITYYSADVQDDPEWDGAIQIHCRNGILLIPYSIDTEGSKMLIVHFATFVPDSAFTSFCTFVHRAIDAVESFFRNIHWSAIRTLLNR